MKIRNSVNIAVVTVMMLTATAATARERRQWTQQEMNAGVDLFTVSESGDWDAATGIDWEIRFWQSHNIGISMGMGIQWWGAPDEYAEDWDEYFYSYTEISGAAAVIPIGAELMYRSSGTGPLRVILSAGLSYAFVDSGVSAYTFYEDYYGSWEYDEPLDIDDTLLFTAGTSLQCQIDIGIAFDVGIKIQKDLQEPQQSYDGQDIGATSFDAAAFTFGLTWDF